MRASAAVGLLLVSSMSIFGIATSHRPNARYMPPVEPVWVNGQMGVYDPDTGVFVPSTSPLFDQTCEKIQLRRHRENGDYSGSSYSGIHHWYYSPGFNSYTYAGRPSPSSWSSGGHSADSSSFGSSRGGIGETGHGFGGGHGGE